MNRIFFTLIFILLSSCSYADKLTEDIAKDLNEFMTKLSSEEFLTNKDFIYYFGTHSDNEYIVGKKLFCSTEDQQIDKKIKSENYTLEENEKLIISEECNVKVDLELDNSTKSFSITYLQDELKTKNESWNIEEVQLVNSRSDKHPYYLITVSINKTVIEFSVYSEAELRDLFGIFWKIKVDNKDFSDFVYSSDKIR